MPADKQHRYLKKLVDIKALCAPTAYKVLDALTLGRGLPRTIAGHRWKVAPECWRAFPPDYEREVVAVLESVLSPGMTAMDIGAHVGIHALTLARLVGRNGRVFAFEPAATSFKLLRRHVRLNRMEERVEATCAAVGDREGSRALITSAAGADPGNSFVDRHYVARKNSEIVEMITLDSFCARRRLLPSLLKIDVEGFEARVLHGARQLLSRRPAPTVVCALHPWHLEQLGDSEERLFELAAELQLTPLTLTREATSPRGEYREILLVPH